MTLMCTMTWIREPGGYQVFFNRDELKTRRAAAPPAVRLSGTTPCIAPTDGDHGGSWIAANPHGLTLCMLNGYRGPDTGAGFEGAPAISRGLLLLSLADARSPSEVLQRTGAIQLERFASFRLAAFHPTLPFCFALWQDRELRAGVLADDACPVVSSSFAPDEVAAARRATFAEAADRRLVNPLAAHLAFHVGHGGIAGPRSVCMHREDADTVSFSRVVVDDRQVRFFYAPHAPHQGLPDAPAVALERC